MRKEAIYYIPMTKKDSEAPLMMEYMLEVGEEVTINRSSSVFNGASSYLEIKIYQKCINNFRYIWKQICCDATNLLSHQRHRLRSSVY